MCMHRKVGYTTIPTCRLAIDLSCVLGMARWWLHRIATARFARLYESICRREDWMKGCCLLEEKSVEKSTFDSWPSVQPIYVNNKTKDRKKLWNNQTYTLADKLYHTHRQHVRQSVWMLNSKLLLIFKQCACGLLINKEGEKNWPHNLTDTFISDFYCTTERLM